MAAVVDAIADVFIAIELIVVAGLLGVEVVLDADRLDTNRHGEIERPTHLHEIAILVLALRAGGG